MSGITGYIKNNIKKVPKDLLSSMQSSVKYTEKDYINKWKDDFLAISRVYHGVVNPESQPIFNEDKLLFIVMEGEVFGYEEQKLKLIRNGHKFEFKNNDAEYCLHLYEEMGEHAFKELNGSFCFAIYNLVSQELLLINDRFSSYPLFYYLTENGMLLFGTQLSAILQSSEVPRELDMRSIFEFLRFQQVFETKTFYRDINAIPPATVLRYGQGNISLTPYWEMRYKKENHSEKYYVDKLAELLKKAIHRRTKGNYRFGLLLSGGLDSRTVLAGSDKKMTCFTFGYFKNREVKIAEKVARVRGCRHIFYKRGLDYYANLVDKAVEIGDGMYPFTHAHNIGFLDKIKKESDILFSGQMLDLLFQGSDLPIRKIKLLGKHILMPWLENLSEKNLKGKILKQLRNTLYVEPAQFFVKPYSEIFNKVLAESIENILSKSRTSDPYNKWDYFVFSHFPAKHLTHLHLTNTRAFMPERTIVFDNDLLDLYLEMPAKLRFKARVLKKALKKISFEIASIPNANTGLPLTVPMFLEWVFIQAKIIFRKIFPARPLSHPVFTQWSWPNHAEMIRHNEKLKNMISKTIKDPECLDPSIFNIRNIEELFEKHLNRQGNYETFLFLLFTFGIWHKKYGPRSL